MLDLGLPDGDGLELLKTLCERSQPTKVIVLTGHGSVQTAVEAMKAGAFDYLSKPIALSELKLAIEKAAGQERLEGTLSYYRGREARQGGLATLLGAVAGDARTAPAAGSDPRVGPAPPRRRARRRC